MTDETKPEAAAPNRDQQIHFRVTADEKKAIEAQSRAAGFQKVSDYLRVLGMGTEVKEALPAELRRELVGIGTSLNQIARLAQSGKAAASHEAQLNEALAIIRGYLV